METKALIEEDNGNEADDFSDDFQCCVCLDLLYKPVVLACGHLACFWCIYSNMNAWHESNCPVCRHPYTHFPSVCQLLDVLLLKLYPVAYKTREKQVGDDEKKTGNFSPQFDYHLSGPQSDEKLNILNNASDPPIAKEGNSVSESMSGDIPCKKIEAVLMPESSSRNSESNLLCNGLEPGNNRLVSVADLLCAVCKKLLFRPVVLNCGHVYCESCMTVPVDGIPSCQVCRSMHPNGFPSVCLVLANFLEEQFPEAYAKRREALLKQANCSKRAQHAARSLSMPTIDYSSWLFGNGPKIHIAVGCDFCGMSPIIGERYKCQDCMEKMGFDLCEACYKNPLKLPGRFNQQHKPDHRMKIVQPQIVNDVLLRLEAEAEQSEDGLDGPEYPEHLHPGPIISFDSPEDPEHLHHGPTISFDPPENAGDGSSGREDISHDLLLCDTAQGPEDDSDTYA